jgi:hypothetical protein
LLMSDLSRSLTKQTESISKIIFWSTGLFP